VLRFGLIGLLLHLSGEPKSGTFARFAAEADFAPILRDGFRLQRSENELPSFKDGSPATVGQQQTAIERR
jgi:hypothetical protein